MFYSAFWLSDYNCCVFVLGGVGRCIFKTQGSHVLGRSMTASPLHPVFLSQAHAPLFTCIPLVRRSVGQCLSCQRAQPHLLTGRSASPGFWEMEAEGQARMDSFPEVQGTDLQRNSPDTCTHTPLSWSSKASRSLSEWAPHFPRTCPPMLGTSNLPLPLSPPLAFSAHCGVIVY